MTRKRSRGSNSIPQAAAQQTASGQQPTKSTDGLPRSQAPPAAAGEPKPLADRKDVKPEAVGALHAIAEQNQAVRQSYDEAKQDLEALRRHTHEAGLQAAALNHQLEQTRDQAAQEAERLAEVRRMSLVVTEGLREAAGGLAALMEEMGEARGRLAELRREADEASRTAAALRTRSLTAATDIAETAAAVRQMLQQAAVDATDYATASAPMGAAGDRTEETTDAAPPMPPHEYVQLGVVVAVDSGLVLEVTPDSPASRAGLAPGDVVSSVNGEPVRSGEDLRSAVSRLGPGGEIVLRLERSGISEEVRAHLTETAASSS